MIGRILIVNSGKSKFVFFKSQILDEFLKDEISFMKNIL